MQAVCSFSLVLDVTDRAWEAAFEGVRAALIWIRSGLMLQRLSFSGKTWHTVFQCRLAKKLPLMLAHMSVTSCASIGDLFCRANRFFGDNLRKWKQFSSGTIYMIYVAEYCWWGHEPFPLNFLKSFLFAPPLLHFWSKELQRRSTLTFDLQVLHKVKISANSFVRDCF